MCGPKLSAKKARPMAASPAITTEKQNIRKAQQYSQYENKSSSQTDIQFWFVILDFTYPTKDRGRKVENMFYLVTADKMKPLHELPLNDQCNLSNRFALWRKVSVSLEIYII